MNHDDLAFLAEVSKTNQAIAVYIGRMLDLDGGRTEYSTSLAEVERQLAARLQTIGQALEAKAAGRVEEQIGPLVIERQTEETP